MADWPRRRKPLDAPVVWQEFQRLIDVLDDVITPAGSSSTTAATIGGALIPLAPPVSDSVTLSGSGNGTSTYAARADHHHPLWEGIAPIWTQNHQWAANVLPSAAYARDVGSLTQPWRSVYAAELVVQTLVAQNVMATIGGRILVGPTTELTRALGNGVGDTTIYVKHNEMASGDRAYLQKSGQVEFLAITSAATEITPNEEYSYTVTRDLDGSGRNSWVAGDAVVNTGTTGDGFIDIYSTSGVNAGTTNGPTIVGNVRNSGTWSDWSSAWAIGNLKNLYGLGGSDIYGAAFGKYANGSSFITVDATNGVRIQNRASGADTVVGQWDASGNLTLGQVATNSGNAYWDNTAKQLKFRGGTNGTVVQAYVDTSGAFTAGGGNVVINSAGVNIAAYTVSEPAGPTTLSFGPSYSASSRYFRTHLTDSPSGLGYSRANLIAGKRNAGNTGDLYFTNLQLYCYDSGGENTAFVFRAVNNGGAEGAILRGDWSGNVWAYGNLSTYNYIYPGTGSGFQSTRYLYDDGSRTKASGGFTTGSDVTAGTYVSAGSYVAATTYASIGTYADIASRRLRVYTYGVTGFDSAIRNLYVALWKDQANKTGGYSVGEARGIYLVTLQARGDDSTGMVELWLFAAQPGYNSTWWYTATRIGGTAVSTFTVDTNHDGNVDDGKFMAHWNWGNNYDDQIAITVDELTPSANYRPEWAAS